MERSHSGRVRLLGKQVRCQNLRGFESPPLRLRHAEALLRRDTVRLAMRKQDSVHKFLIVCIMFIA